MYTTDRRVADLVVRGMLTVETDATIGDHQSDSPSTMTGATDTPVCIEDTL